MNALFNFHHLTSLSSLTLTPSHTPHKTKQGAFPIPVWFDNRDGTDFADQMPPLNGSTFTIILPVAITVAAIGLLESLLTLEIIDELTETKGNGSREAFAQGLGQFFSGAFGGMGGCTTIVSKGISVHHRHLVIRKQTNNPNDDNTF